MVEKLLKIRKEIKKRKPTYKRVQSHQFAKFSEVKWRKPKGLGNKIRRKRRGKPSMPEVGFKSPKQVRGLNKNGFREILVYNLDDLKKVDFKTSIPVIGSKVGNKKKLELLQYANENKIKIANIKNIETSIKKISITKEENKKIRKVLFEKKEEKSKLNKEKNTKELEKKEEKSLEKIEKKTKVEEKEKKEKKSKKEEGKNKK